MTTYSATVTREGLWWVADVDGVGVTQGRNLGELHRMAVDLVASLNDVPAREVTIEFNVDIPRVTPKIAAMRRAMQKAVEAQEAAARESRAVAREMRSMGLSVGDVAKVLKVSPQRVSQLTASTPPRKTREAVSAGGTTKAASRRRPQRV